MPTIALDGTVVRPPLSGVHYAVRDQMLALLQDSQPQDWLPLTLDPTVRALAATAAVPMPELPPYLARVSLRVGWQQTRLPALLRREGCRALAALAYTAPGHCPVPYALQVHDLIGLRRPDLCSRLNALHMRTLMPRSITQATSLLVTSHTVADQVRDLFPAQSGRLQVLPLAAADRFQVLDPQATRPPELDRPYILFVGVLEPKKGVPTLCDAYARVAARHPHVDLVLAGRVGWRCADLLQRLDHWTGPGRIRRLGYVPEPQLPRLYRHARSVVVPSEEEGFGLPVLEAMACGAPVVHSDQAAVQETAGDAGVPFARGDADALAAALTRLLASDDYCLDRAQAGLARGKARSYRDWARDFRTVMVDLG